MNKKILFTNVFIVFFLLGTDNLQADTITQKDTFYMSFSRPMESDEGKFIELFFAEAFKRLGKKVVIAYYPTKRINKMLEKGELDGDVIRSYDFGKSYPDLIRVEEPIGTVNISAFTSNPNIKIKNWRSLKGTEYKVECMRGSKICEDNLPKFVDEDKLSYVTHWSQGLGRLVLGWTDIYIEAEETILPALKTDKFKNAKIYVAGVMAENTIHTYLKREHSAFATELGMTIREMKNDGSMEKYKKIAFSSSD